MYQNIARYAKWIMTITTLGERKKADTNEQLKFGQCKWNWYQAMNDTNTRRWAVVEEAEKMA